MGDEQRSSTQTGPKGKWVGIELQRWRDRTLKEPPDNSSFQEMASKHQDQEHPRSQGSGPVTHRWGNLSLNDSCVLLGLGRPSCILTHVKMRELELTAFDRLLGFCDAHLG